MDNTFILDVLDKGTCMMNVEQEMNIYHLLTQTIIANVEGAVVELGCYDGSTAIIMQKTLLEHNSPKKLHLYDSFEGVPEPTDEDGDTLFKKGFCSCTEETLLENFSSFGLSTPEIHKGWFKEILSSTLPEKISFAHLDGDLYSSIKESLEYVYPKLSAGAIVVIDDYADPETHQKIQELTNKNKYSQRSGRKFMIKDILPGVKQACDEFFYNKPESVSVLISGEERHGYFRKL